MVVELFESVKKNITTRWRRYCMLLMVVFVILVCPPVFGGEDVIHKNIRKRDISPNKFIQIRKSCTREGVTIVLETPEAFRGAVYAKGYPQDPCKTYGTGHTLTNLTLQIQTCGLKVLERESGKHDTLEVQVYIQFDRYVQQVIDEQVHVRCVVKQPLTPTHLTHKQKLNKIIDKKKLENLSKLFKTDSGSKNSRQHTDKSSLIRKYSFKGADNSVIIQGYDVKKGAEGRESSEQSSELSSKASSPFTTGIQVGTGSPGQVVSEIKISSSPVGQETEALVASTLLTVSSRVKERLKSRESAKLRKSIGKKKTSERSTTISDLLKRMSGQVTLSPESTNTSKDSKTRPSSTTPVPKRSSPSEAASDWKPMTRYDADNEIGEDDEEPVSVWMDIVKGKEYNGRKVLSSLDVGEDVTVVVRSRTRAGSGLNTTVTECVAHDGTEGGVQDLTDSRGCAVDDSIMPRLSVVNEGDVAISYATFKAFKFPDKSSLHLRCTVLICAGRCPKSNCAVVVPRPPLPSSSALKSRSGRAMGEVIGVGEFEPADAFDSHSLTVKQSLGGVMLVTSPDSNRHRPPVTKTPNIDPLSVLKDISKWRTVTSKPSQSVAAATSEQHSNDRFGTVVDRVEVFNSVEVRASGIESDPQDLVKRYRSALEGEDRSEERRLLLDDSMFCIGSQKLLLSFGVLLFILLSALVFSLYTCARHRLMSKKLRYDQRDAKFLRHLERSPTPGMACNSTVISSSSRVAGRPMPPPPRTPNIIAPDNYYRFHR